MATADFLEQTQVQEKRIHKKELIFFLEKSILCNLDYNFNWINNLSFIKHLDSVNKASGTVLELGGGSAQVAALSIMEQWPNLDFTGLEIRSLDPEARKLLESYLDFRHIQAGISQLTEVLPGEKFDMIFAHNVAEALPFPMETIAYLYEQIMADNGLVFINRIPVSIDVCQNLIAYWRKIGLNVNYDNRRAPDSLLKKGIAYTSLTIQKTSDQLPLPLIASEPIADYTGHRLITHDYTFAP